MPQRTVQRLAITGEELNSLCMCDLSVQYKPSLPNHD